MECLLLASFIINRIYNTCLLFWSLVFYQSTLFPTHSLRTGINKRHWWTYLKSHSLSIYILLVQVLNGTVIIKRYTIVDINLLMFYLQWQNVWTFLGYFSVCSLSVMKSVQLYGTKNCCSLSLYYKQRYNYYYCHTRLYNIHFLCSNIFHRCICSAENSYYCEFVVFITVQLLVCWTGTVFV